MRWTGFKADVAGTRITQWVRVLHGQKHAAAVLAHRSLVKARYLMAVSRYISFSIEDRFPLRADAAVL